MHGHSESSESWSPYGDINDTSDNFPEPEGTQISTILTVVSLCVDEDFSGDCKK